MSKITQVAARLAVGAWPITAAALAVLAAPVAHASPPPCAVFDTCKYMPNPVDGPLMPTWDTPGTYGGWTTLPVLCDPVSYQCRQVAPGN